MFFEKYWFHFLVLAAILLAQANMRNLLTQHYHQYTKPKLINEGYRSCNEYEPLIKKYKPSNCDLVKYSKKDNQNIEVYFTTNGEEKTRVTSENSKWRSTQTDLRFNQKESLLSGIAFFLIFISILHKMIRTGKITNVGLLGEKNSKLETILFIYGIPIFLFSTFIF